MSADDCEYGESIFCTDFVVESPTARMAMTDPTPMMIPSIVSSERTRLVHTTCSACPKNSSILLMPETLDRLEAACAHGRIGTEEQTDGNRRAKRGRHDRQPV